VHSGTSPLPIHQAYLSGRSGAGVTTPVAVHGDAVHQHHVAGRASSDLDAGRGQRARAIDTTAFRANALAAGLPVNFFVMNPNASQRRLDRPGSEGTRYNSLQVDSVVVSRRACSSARTTRTASASHSPTDASVSTGWKWTARVCRTSSRRNWTYELPVGRGRRFGTDMNPILNGVLGNWEFSGNARVQTQRYRITNAKLVGMTRDELQGVQDPHLQGCATGTTTVYSMAQDIIDNTRRPTTPTRRRRTGTGRHWARRRAATSSRPAATAASRSTVATATRRTSTSTARSSRVWTCASRSRSRS
jgi:hypothetical protein